jgi:MFS family permease
MPDDMKSQPPLDQLWTRGFIGLIVSQFAGAFNDNLLKGILLVLVAIGNEWSGVLGSGGTGWISVLLTGPFILCLGWAGQLADRYSKRTMVLWVRLTELPIVVVIGIGLLSDSPWVTIGGFLALATQSAFFNPPKYGMIREVTGPGQLSRANGVISLATNISIIAGVAVSGQLLEYGRGLVALLLLCITIVGVVSAWSIPKLPAMNPQAQLRWNPFGEVISDLLAMRVTPVWTVSWIWSAFFFAAILLVSAIPDMQHELDVSMSGSTLLLGAAGLGIGIGCVIAGWCSGSMIRSVFVGYGAGAVAIAYLLMAVVPSGWWMMFMLLLLLGMASGFFLVPLLAMMQRLSPPEERGRWLAASNWLCYVLMSLAGLTYALASSLLGVHGTFLVCSGVMAIIVIVLLVYPHALQFKESEYA